VAKKKKSKEIKLGAKAVQRLTSIIVEHNKFLATAKDVLNVPDDWTVTHNENGIPDGFAPKKEE